MSLKGKINSATFKAPPLPPKRVRWSNRDLVPKTRANGSMLVLLKAVAYHVDPASELCGVDPVAREAFEPYLRGLHQQLNEIIEAMSGSDHASWKVRHSTSYHHVRVAAARWDQKRKGEHRANHA